MGKRQKQYPKGAFVRLTNDEHMRLTALAKKADLSFSRFLVESGLTGQAPTNEDRIQRERAILQLARVGNNLNQIARQLNAQRGALSSRDLAETLREVKATLERIEALWQRGSRSSTSTAHFEELK
jgi:ribosome-binding protein aMBF1 (putative translation factor)